MVPKPGIEPKKYTRRRSKGRGAVKTCAMKAIEESNTFFDAFQPGGEPRTFFGESFSSDALTRVSTTSESVRLKSEAILKSADSDREGVLGYPHLMCFIFACVCTFVQFMMRNAFAHMHIQANSVRTEFACQCACVLVALAQAILMQLSEHSL